MASRRRAFGVMLWQLADLVQADERRRSFRSKAYRRAVWSLDRLDPDLEAEPSEILGTPGIGPGTAGLIEEFRKTGTLARFEQLQSRFPKDTPALRRLPRMTPALLKAMKTELGVDTTADLMAAIETESALTLRGVAGATLQLWKTIIDLPPRKGMIPSHRAWVTSHDLAEHLRDHVGGRVETAGSVRRVEEWVDRLDIVMAPRSRRSLYGFLETTAAVRRAERQARGTVLLETHTAIPAVLWVATPETMGSTMIMATGPPCHLAEMFDDQDAPPSDTEERVYGRHGVQWIPPAARGLPLDRATAVVRAEDIRGDLHIHSERSPDGRLPLPAILEAAVERSYEYVLITDHTIGLHFGGLGRQEILEQAEQIDRLRSEYSNLTVFHGAEINIGPDGSLDLDDETLSLLDVAVAGVHSNFNLPRQQQTSRVITALAHPAVGVLAHPTGRRIGIRPAIDLDLEAVVEAAIDGDVALECNGHRDRLDLSSEWVELAAAKGATFVANSDAHRKAELGNLENAVATLQRAGITRSRVINARPVGEITEWILRRAGQWSDWEAH